jgi:uncharacterized membrane protein
MVLAGSSLVFTDEQAVNSMETNTIQVITVLFIFFFSSIYKQAAKIHFFRFVSEKSVSSRRFSNTLSKYIK